MDVARSAARAGRSDGDLRIPATTSRRQTGSPGHVYPLNCTSDGGVRCRMLAAPRQPWADRAIDNSSVHRLLSTNTATQNGLYQAPRYSIYCSA
eukprot:SAG31_NODE_430_length_15792_cov_15.908558_16_plen_94_part_00